MALQASASSSATRARLAELPLLLAPVHPGTGTRTTALANIDNAQHARVAPAQIDSSRHRTRERFHVDIDCAKTRNSATSG